MKLNLGTLIGYGVLGLVLPKIMGGPGAVPFIDVDKKTGGLE